MSTTTSPTDYPYCCHVDVAFPTAQHAQQTMRVMQVDEEIGDQVQKSFALLKNIDNDNNEQTTVRISFQATEAKFLRVSVSSFYDYLAVALKVYQEFDHTTTTTSSTTAL